MVLITQCTISFFQPNLQSGWNWNLDFPNKLLKHVASVDKEEVVIFATSEQGQTESVLWCMGATRLIKDGPAGCYMAVTERGYINVPTFVKWLGHFKNYSILPTESRPVLLVLDNHAAYMSYDAVCRAKSNIISTCWACHHTAVRRRDHYYTKVF